MMPSEFIDVNRTAKFNRGLDGPIPGPGTKSQAIQASDNSNHSDDVNVLLA